MDARTLSVFLHIVVTSIVAVERNVLNDYIRHYETLTYDVSSLEHSHGRVRRSLDTSIRLSFHAHQRSFNIVLRPDDTTFVRHPEEVLPDRSVRPLDTSHIYQGFVEGVPSSYVHGSIIDGILSGRIDLPTESYYVEKSEMYFTDAQPFHSVIYAGSDVAHDLPSRVKRSISSPSSAACGSSRDDVRRWMESVQNSAVEPSSSSDKDSSPPQQQQFSMRHDSYFRRYSRWAEPDGEWAEPARQRRAARSPDHRMCALFLQSDPLLWEYMTKPVASGGKGYTADRAREEITSLFASHVDGIKKIYFNTVFRYDNIGPFTGFTFAVHRVQINTSADCNRSDSQNPFCKRNIDVSNFLNLNSLSNHKLYCLAYVFTYRDFSQGTLGLAWVGSSLKASGGVCEIWKEYSENGRRVYKSLNTGIVTLVNYGSRVPPKVSTLTFAHEIGHNFGSPHDSGPDCVPTIVNPNFAGGNYIMFASATSGDRPNNHNFSLCSIGNMTLVLNAVLNGINDKHNCFQDSMEAFCGNRIVEDKEECDCGFERDCEEHGDRCCYPQEHEKKPCRRREHAMCSLSEGPCCQHNCSYVSFAEHSLCLPDMECSKASFCNGTSAKCPMPEPKTDGSLCNSNTQVCRGGECAGSVCERINWTACSLAAPVNDKKFNRGQLCYVSCWNEETGQCVSTGNVDDIYKSENKPLLDFLTDRDFMPNGIQLPAGAPCDNFKGYCDVFQKCRAVNEDGPLARLKNLLFNRQTIEEVRDWITEYWWAVLLMSVGLVVLMAVFIKVCAVHTPSSNPRQPPARKLTLPRRHTHRSQDHGQPPPYSSGQIPLRQVPSGGPPHGKRRNRQQPSSSASSQQPKPQRFADLGAGPSSAAAAKHGRSNRHGQQV